MNSTPLVSVITPMYNAEKYILKTVQSVLAQSYDNWEMLIVDNKSTDSSRETVTKIDDKRIKLIELESNSGGPARPRNIGLEQASGDLVAYLDSDDVWLADKLEKQVRVLQESEFDIVCSLAYTIDTESNKTGTLKNQTFFKVLKFIMQDASVIYYSNYININSVLMRADKNIKFDEDKRVAAVEDWAYWMEHCYSGKRVYLLKEYLLKYRVDANSMSSRDTDQSYRKILYLLAVMLLNKKIPLKHYCFSHFLNFGKVILKNITLLFKVS